MTDPDGVFGGPGDQDIHAIAASDEGLVAVGSTDCSAVGVDYPSSTETPFKTNPLQRCPRVWISQDGIGWEVLDSDAIRVLDGRPFREVLADAPFAPDPSFEARGYEMRDVDVDRPAIRRRRGGDLDIRGWANLDGYSDPLNLDRGRRRGVQSRVPSQLNAW